MRTSLCLSICVLAILSAPELAAAAWTSSLAGPHATIVGSGGSDAIIINAVVLEDTLLMGHNRFSAGDPGFASNLDWNTSVEGVQLLAASVTSSLTINSGAGEDTIQIGDDEPAANLRIPIFLDDSSGDDLLIIDNTEQDLSGIVHRFTTSSIVTGSTTITRAGIFTSGVVMRLATVAETLLIDSVYIEEPLIIRGFGGAGDTITLGDGDAMGTINGLVSFDGTHIGMKLRVRNDLRTSGLNGQLTNSALTGLTGGAVTLPPDGSVDTLRLSFGSGQDVMRVHGGFSGAAVSVELGDGNDRLFVVGRDFPENVSLFGSGEDGSDQFFVRTAPSESSAYLLFDGGDGVGSTDTIEFDGLLDDRTPPTHAVYVGYTPTDSSFDVFGATDVNFAGMENVTANRTLSIKYSVGSLAPDAECDSVVCGVSSTGRVPLGWQATICQTISNYFDFPLVANGYTSNPPITLDALNFGGTIEPGGTLTVGGCYAGAEPGTINLTMNVLDASGGVADDIVVGGSVSINADGEPGSVVYTVTDLGEIVRMQGSYPFDILSSGYVDLLTDTPVRGIDFRPVSGELFILGSESLMSIAPLPFADVHAKVRTIPLSSTIPAGKVVMDFDPVGDRLLVVNRETAAWYVISMTGEVTPHDPLLYGIPAGGDVVPNLFGLAYSNPFFDATSTTAYGIDLKSPPFIGPLDFTNGVYTPTLTLDGTFILPIGIGADADIAASGLLYLVTSDEAIENAPLGANDNFNLSVMHPGEGQLHPINRRQLEVDGLVVGGTLYIPPVPTLQVANYLVEEPLSGSSTMELFLVVSPAPAPGSSVRFSVLSGTAIAGEDMEEITDQEVVFGAVAPGEQSVNISIPIRIFSDQTDEPNETFQVQFFGGDGLYVATPLITVTIFDRDQSNSQILEVLLGNSGIIVGADRNLDAVVDSADLLP